MKSAASYYKNKGFYDGLFAEDPATRTWAYSDALAILDDNHTALISVNPTWGLNSYKAARRYGDNCLARSVQRNELGVEREEAYTAMGYATAEQDIVYSSDGKTALFSFDSFTFGSSIEVFNDDGTISTTAKNVDTYFTLINVFQTIKNKGTVENVVLDVSLNGGGTVGVMMKLLALISKDNNGYLALYEDTTTQLSIATAQVDINDDGVYDTKDCFGDDFNIYIVTSDCSFSCGNAFPCIAQAKGYAKIIGQKSGGGECAVAVHYLPNSEYVYHSSNLHLGIYDEATETFTGFENGATPDIEYGLGNPSYKVDNINNAILNAQK